MFGLEGVLIQGGFKLFLALVGILLGRATLLWFDSTLKNTKFTNWLDGADDNAKAVYYSGRFIAVAIIVGCAIG